MPGVMFDVNGIMQMHRNAGRASSRAPADQQPALAQMGTFWKVGVKKVVSRNAEPVTTEASPVQAPSCTPVAHSKKTMQGLDPSIAPIIFESATLKNVICEHLPGRMAACLSSSRSGVLDSASSPSS
ncbi:hypothetical protein DIPPA_33578 [Diplonema papillatum]|nr:hypothetical protein DIPPA_33578 [Diplonema papillatum]KAJ9459475.1 hypothetical protein DIPPA_33578 [Diplonema papillatum]